MKVMLMPFAMAAIFFRTGILIQYTERHGKWPRAAGVANHAKQRLFGRSGGFRRWSGRGVLGHGHRALQPRGVPEVEKHLRPCSKTVSSEVKGLWRSLASEPPSLSSW